LNPEIKNQAEQLASGHMILSIDIAERIILNQKK
jgi:hypothetical protein